KEDIGKYFSDIEKTMISVKEKLQEEVSKNGQYEKVKKVVEEFISGTVDKIAAGAKEAALGASGGGSEAVGNAKANEDAKPAEVASVNKLVKGIKEIVEIVLKGRGDAGADFTKGESKKDVGKLFTTTDADRADNAAAQAAAASIGAINGVDMLQAIAKSSENPTVNEAEGIEKAEDAAGIAVAKAVAGKKEIKVDSAKKDAVIAGGIALRGMTKGGKFSIKNNENDAVKTVNGAVAGAVNKVLSTLTIAIRNRVDLGLKEINKVLGEIKQGEGSESKVKAN
ncbi:variable large family protein, partial [Borrelia crocidurae]